jgi:hypothetical protein
MADPQSPGSSELLHRISERLRAAAEAAGAAESCAAAGNLDLALAMLSDVEPWLYEVTTLLNAASILRGNHTR